MENAGAMSPRVADSEDDIRYQSALRKPTIKVDAKYEVNPSWTIQENGDESTSVSSVNKTSTKWKVVQSENTYSTNSNEHINWLEQREITQVHMWPLLLTWFNFNPSMDK